MEKKKVEKANQTETKRTVGQRKKTNEKRTKAEMIISLGEMRERKEITDVIMEEDMMREREMNVVMMAGEVMIVVMMAGEVMIGAMIGVERSVVTAGVEDVLEMLGTVRQRRGHLMDQDLQ